MPEARTALINCVHCGRLAPGPRGIQICLPCLKAIGKRAACPDCDSRVNLIIGDDEVRLDIRHDPTCPAWLAFCAENHHPSQDDVLWPITPQQPEG
jgi:hypothetical protein